MDVPEVLQRFSRGPQSAGVQFACCPAPHAIHPHFHFLPLPLPPPPPSTSSPLCNSCLTVHQQVPPTVPSKPVKHFTGGRRRHWDSCRNISSGSAGGAVVPPPRRRNEANIRAKSEGVRYLQAPGGRRDAMFAQSPL